MWECCIEGKWRIRRERTQMKGRQAGGRDARKRYEQNAKDRETSLDLLRCIVHSGKSTVFTNRIRPAGITNQQLLSKYRTSESHVNYQNWTAGQQLLSQSREFTLRDKRNYHWEFYKLYYTRLKIKESKIQKLVKRLNHRDLFKRN